MSPLSELNHRSQGTPPVGRVGFVDARDRGEFRAAPPQGYTRKDLARLIGLHPRSIKRVERKAPSLGVGRTKINQRVLYYSIVSVREFLASTTYRVDLYAAIRLGFPLTALPPERFARPVGRGGWVTLPLEEVMLTQSSWAAWSTAQRLKHVTPDLPPEFTAELDQATIYALVSLVEANPSRTRLGQLGSVAGRSIVQMEEIASRARKRLHEQLRTTRGQLLFAALLAEELMPPAASVGLDASSADRPPNLSGKLR